jgi:hypothetical protein
MATTTTDVRRVGQELERAGNRAAASPWARRLARFGLLCRAVVYAVLATLALLAAAGMGGRTTDTRGAIATLAREPFGAAIVATLGVGFAALGLWYLAESALNLQGRRGGKGAALRLGKGVVAFVYFGLTALCARIALGAGASSASGDERAQSYTAAVLQLPAGRLLVAAGAVLALAVAGYQVKKALKARRGEKIDGGRMGPALRRWAPRLGLAGYVTRGLVVALIALFLALAALHENPREATGFDGALAALAGQPFGMALLGAAALGLLAFAAYSAVEARYKRL